MSSFIYYKIPFEGKIESVNDLIRTREWKVTLKMPDNGTLLMKIPEDIEEEVLFNQDLVFDEKTNSKFGSFSKISESDFEIAESMDIPKTSVSNENIENKEKEKKIKLKDIYDNSGISLKDDDFVKKISEKKSNESIINSLKKSITLNLPTSINLEEYKKMAGNYKDPYDFFFSQNYLIVFFIVAVIFLILFRL